VAVHAGHIERLNVEGIGARARAHEALAQHLVLLVAAVVVVRAPAAAGARGSRRGVGAAVVGALDLVLLAGAARHHPPHLRRLHLTQSPAAAAPGLHPDRGGEGRGARVAEACFFGFRCCGGVEKGKGRDEEGGNGGGGCRGETELQSAAVSCQLWELGYSSPPTFIFLVFLYMEKIFLLFLNTFLKLFS